MECFKNGLISKEMTGGLDLKFGNASAMLTLVEQIAKKRGFGKILAEGMEEAVIKGGFFDVPRIYPFDGDWKIPLSITYLGDTPKLSQAHRPGLALFR